MRSKFLIFSTISFSLFVFFYFSEYYFDFCIGDTFYVVNYFYLVLLVYLLGCVYDLIKYIKKKKSKTY